MPEPPSDIDRTKIRLGLALVTLVVAAALVILVAADSALARAIMFAIAVTGFVRAYRLVRALRADAR